MPQLRLADACGAWLEASVPRSRAARLMYLSSGINAVGTGMFLVVSAIFFVRYRGFAADQVGLGLSAGAIVGLIVGIPAGRLADVVGARRLYLGSLCVEAAAMLSYLMVHSYQHFLAATVVASIGGAVSSSARGPLIRMVAIENPSTLRGQINSVSNVGYLIGGGCAGIALAADAHWSYPLLIAVNALSFLGCAFAVTPIDLQGDIDPAPQLRRRSALRDVRYLALSGMNTVLSLQYSVLSFVLPIWILRATALPRWTIALCIPLNTILVVLLQGPISTRITDQRQAGRAYAQSGWILAVSFAAMALLHGVPAWCALSLLSLAIVVNAGGECLWAAGSYELSYSLARPEATGEYLALYSVSGGLGRAASQGVLGLLCLQLGEAGWLIFAVLTVAAAQLPALLIGLDSKALSRRTSNLLNRLLATGRRTPARQLPQHQLAWPAALADVDEDWSEQGAHV